MGHLKKNNRFFFLFVYRDSLASLINFLKNKTLLIIMWNAFPKLHVIAKIIQSIGFDTK